MSFYLRLAALALLLSAIPAQAQNLVVNGDFSLGNTGFTSDYPFATTNGTEGEYGIVSTTTAWNGAFFANYGDHTTGTGLMMIVNGHPVAEQRVWAQSVSINSNTNYIFSAFAATPAPISPALLSFRVNGIEIGQLQLSSELARWDSFSGSWNSGLSTTALLTIVDLNTSSTHNDFSLDDISFAAGSVAAPEPGTLVYLGVASVLGLVRGVRRKV